MTLKASVLLRFSLKINSITNSGGANSAKYNVKKFGCWRFVSKLYAVNAQGSAL